MNEEFEYDKFNKDPDYEPAYYNLNDNSNKDYDVNQYYQTPLEYREQDELNATQNSLINNSKTSNYFHYNNNNKTNYNYPNPYEITFPVTRRSLKHSNNDIMPIKKKINVKYQDSAPLTTNYYDKENYDLVSSQYEIKNLIQVYDASKEKENIFDKKNKDAGKKSSPPKYFRQNIVYSIFDENENNICKNPIKKLNTDLFNTKNSKYPVNNSNKKKSCNNLLKSNREKKREISNKKENNTDTTNTTTHIYIDLGDRTTAKNTIIKIDKDNPKSSGTNSCNNVKEKLSKKMLTPKDNSTNKAQDIPKFKQILIKGKNQNKTKDTINFIDSRKMKKEKSIIQIKKNNINKKIEETSESSEQESEEEEEKNIIIVHKQEIKKKEKNIIAKKNYKKKNKKQIQNEIEKDKKEKGKDEGKDEHESSRNSSIEIEEKSSIRIEEDKKDDLNGENKYELSETKKKTLAIKTEEEMEIKEVDFEKIKDKIQNIDNEKQSLNSDIPLLSLVHTKISSFSNKNLPKTEPSNLLSNEGTKNNTQKKKKMLNRSILFSNSEKKIEYPLLFRNTSEKSIDEFKYNTESVLKDYNFIKSISNLNNYSIVENREISKKNENKNKETANKINIKKNINVGSLRDNHNLITIKSTRGRQASNNNSIMIMNSNSKILSNTNNINTSNNINENIESKLPRENNHIIHNSYGNCKGRGVSTNTEVNKKRIVSIKTEMNDNLSKNKLKNHCVKVTYGSSMSKNNNNTFNNDREVKKNLLPTPAKSNHSLYVSGYSKKLNK